MVGRPAQSSGHSPFISVKARVTGAGVPGDYSGAPGHNVLGQPPRERQAHKKSGGGAGPAGRPLQSPAPDGSSRCSWPGDSCQGTPASVPGRSNLLSVFLCTYSVVQWGREKGVARKSSVGTAGRPLREEAAGGQRGRIRARTGDVAPVSGSVGAIARI